MVVDLFSVLPNLVLVSLHVGLVHLHRVKLQTTHLTQQGGGCSQQTLFKRHVNS